MQRLRTSVSIARTFKADCPSFETISFSRFLLERSEISTNTGRRRSPRFAGAPRTFRALLGTIKSLVSNGSPAGKRVAAVWANCRLARTPTRDQLIQPRLVIHSRYAHARTDIISRCAIDKEENGERGGTSVSTFRSAGDLFFWLTTRSNFLPNKYTCPKCHLMPRLFNFSSLSTSDSSADTPV